MDKLNIFLPIVIYEDAIINTPELVNIGMGMGIDAAVDTNVGVNVYADVYADIDDMHE